MSATPVLEIPVVHAPAALSAEANAALRGLSAKRKYLPSWLFYDAEGSRLFEAITRLPEYYLTAREHAIFSEHAAEMIDAAMGAEPLPLSVVELGAGSATKTIVLLRALVARQGAARYVPVDISPAALESAAKNVHAALPGVAVEPVCSEIRNEHGLALPQEGRRLALYIGSSIGNFDPEEAVELLTWLRLQLEPGDALLLGTDMVKDVAPMMAAYNDSAKVTAAFNKNILTRLNRELGANFDLDDFGHRAIWSAAHCRMEMHLDSRRDQAVRIPRLGRSFHFERGESIHTENSHKFTPEKVREILEDSGFSLEQSWYDGDRWFGVHLARVVGSEALMEESAA